MADTLASASKYSSPPLTTSTASFMQRLEIAVSGGSGGLASNGGKGSGGPQSPDPGSWERRVADPECTFKPKITKKGTSQKPRSFEDMSEGDRLKKEAWRTRKQREKEAREMEGVSCLLGPLPYAGFPHRRLTLPGSLCRSHSAQGSTIAGTRRASCALRTRQSTWSLWTRETEQGYCCPRPSFPRRWPGRVAMGWGWATRDAPRACMGFWLRNRAWRHLSVLFCLPRA